MDEMLDNKKNRIDELLSIEDFKMCFNGKQGAVHAVKGVSLSVNPGEIVALVGESGSGKTALCFSILMLHAEQARYLSGKIKLRGRDVMGMTEEELRAVRGTLASIVFQDPLNSLDPVRTIGEQIITPMVIHHSRHEYSKSWRISKSDRNWYENRAISLLNDMGMDDAESYLKCYPHQLSGGQRQRVAIAIALACDPMLIIADEPTTALDPANQVQIIDLLKKLAAEKGKGILFVTHDLSLARGLASKVAVMKDGLIVERGNTREIFENPETDYTKALVRYSRYGKKGSHHHGYIYEEKEAANTLIKVNNITMAYAQNKNRTKKVLDDFSLEVFSGEILGLVGESGCGKSTLAKIIMGILKPISGSVVFGNCQEDAVNGYANQKNMGQKNINIQMIFQDSASAFNSRMTIEEIIAEPLVIAKKYSKEERHKKVLMVMEQVHLSKELLKRHPYDVSGGQHQRAAIARALITDPDFIIADEPLSSLDVPTQAEIVHLLRELHDSRQLTMILISHDIPMVEHVCDRIVEMKRLANH